MTCARSDLELRPEELWLRSIGEPANVLSLPWGLDPRQVLVLQFPCMRSTRSEARGFRLVRAL